MKPCHTVFIQEYPQKHDFLNIVYTICKVYSQSEGWQVVAYSLICHRLYSTVVSRRHKSI